MGQRLALQAKWRVLSFAMILSNKALDQWLTQMARMSGPPAAYDQDGRQTVMEALRHHRDQNPVIMVVGDAQGNPVHTFTLGSSGNIKTDSLNGTYAADHKYRAEMGDPRGTTSRVELRVIAVIDVDEFMEHFGHETEHALHPNLKHA